MAWFCAQRALEISQDTGSAVRAESLATAALCMGLQNEIQQFETYMTQARELAGKQLDVLKTIEQLSGIIYAGLAKWDQATSAFEKAIDAAKTVGDLKSLEESTLFAGTVHFLKGDIQRSVKLNQGALESATKRGDAQVQVYSSILQARNYYVLGENFESNCSSGIAHPS